MPVLTNDPLPQCLQPSPLTPPPPDQGHRPGRRRYLSNVQWPPYGVLDEAGEAVADPLGGAAVEAERVLVEVGGEVLLAHRAVVGAQQPALDEAEDEMDRRQPERGVAPGRAEIDGLVVVALGRQAEVAAPAVGGRGRPPRPAVAGAAGLARGGAGRAPGLGAGASAGGASRSRPRRRPRASPR